MAKLKQVFKVYIIESERGWGSTTETEYYTTEKEALKRIKSVNDADKRANKNTVGVPDFYIIARQGW